MKKIISGAFLAVLVLAVVLAGCGGGGGGGGTPTPTPTATATPTPTPTATPTTPPGPSVQGTWRSQDVNPPVTVIVGEYLGSQEVPGGLIFYYYAGEIQCSVYPEGSYKITSIPPAGYHNSIYATTMFGFNYLYVRGGGENDPDRVEFEGWLSAADKAQGELKIYDGGTEIWNAVAVFNRS